MTDGPHKSLNLPSRWKKVAELADQEVWDQDDINAAVKSALIWTFNQIDPSIRKQIQNEMGDLEDCLFREAKVLKLEALRSGKADNVLLHYIIEGCKQRLERAAPSVSGFTEVLGNAMKMLAASHSRQIEEHYLRKSNVQRARHVRARIGIGLNNVSYESLARQALSPNNTMRGPGPKRSGLDEGPRK